MVQIILEALAGNSLIKLLIIAILLDTILGTGRALRFHSFNSSVGIDGAIRKVSMLVSAFLLMTSDLIVNFNLVAFIPEEYLKIFGLEKVGLCELFVILFLVFEAISILKNMVLCGLPVPVKIREWLEKFLDSMTGELKEEKEK